MNIYVFEPDSLEGLRPFIGKCPFLPFKNYMIKQDLIVNYVIKELSDVASRGGLIIVAEEDSKFVGLISSEKLDWDSNHFGIDISRIGHLLSFGDYYESFNVKQKLISYLLTKCCNQLSLHLSARVNKEDLSSLHALETHGFRLMDVLVKYFFDLRKYRKINTEYRYTIRRFKEAEISELAEIARECFIENPVATDRFHADPTLSKEKSGELYVKWVIDSFQDSSDEILVAELDGKPVGFNICNINKSINKQLGMRFGTITLTAVRPYAREKLVATTLLQASLAWFRDKVDVVETGGQVSNYAIQRAWCKVGFKIIRSQCTFHWSVLADSL